jgi:hypothetical protein
MRRSLTIVVLLLVLAVSLGLYRLESEVKILERRLANAATQLEENRRNNRILAAEWSFLNQPSRLQALARRHLDLGHLAPAQVSRLAELPLKPAPRDSVGNRDGDRNSGQNSGGAAAIPNIEPSGQPPIPGRKPVKPENNRDRKRNKGGRIVLADGGRAGQ